MAQSTMISIGRWWTELSPAEQLTFIHYLQLRCRRNLIEPQSKLDFVQNVCLRIFDPEEGNGEINQESIADLTRPYGYGPGQVLIITKHLFDEFQTALSIKQAIKLMGLSEKDVDHVRTLCRHKTISASKNRFGHWRILPSSITNHLIPNRLL